MSKNYRWGILGAGRIAEKFCTALDFTEGSQVYAVASRDADKAKAYANKFNAVKFYDNYDDLINDENVDIIYIATPHAFHHDQAIACLRKNKAVLCEKPMSLSYDQTNAMIETATENKVFFMEGMWTACMPFMKKIRSLIDEDVIGAPQYLSADFGFTAPVDFEGRLYNKALGGGSIMDVGIYPLYLATMLLGEPSVIKTIAKLAATGIDEYANIILQYANGATAHLLSAINFNTGIGAQIIGTKGKIIINNPWFKATEFSVHLNDDTIQSFSMPHLCNGFEYEIQEVMHCIDNGLLQSMNVPHYLTLSVSKIIDDVLQQAGVVYK
ncbi:MAG: Gfo/Idh/MocA family oxidoreductase [Ferruginibacter sp.]